MGIWDEAEAAESAEEENSYLSDSKKGIELIARLLPRIEKINSEMKTARKLDRLLDTKILSTVRRLGLRNVLGLVRGLKN